MPLPHEAIAANNRVPFQITPRTDKLRVIYMEGTPAQEYRFIQDALQEDPNIKCVSMYVDNQYVAQQRLHRVDDPRLGFPTTREELLSYDVVICSDIARASFTPEQLDWTVELVNKRGGGFVMIGGHTSFGSGGWDQTVWDGLIPVDMSGRGTGPLGTLRWLVSSGDPDPGHGASRSGGLSMTRPAIARSWHKCPCSTERTLPTGSSRPRRLSVFERTSRRVGRRDRILVP